MWNFLNQFLSSNKQIKQQLWHMHDRLCSPSCRELNQASVLSNLTIGDGLDYQFFC